MDIANIITIGGGLVSLGIVYGTISGKISDQQKRIDQLETHHDTLIEVKTKLDLILIHFLKQEQQ
jgi:hypothetical protein